MSFYEEQVQSELVYNGLIVDIKRDKVKIQTEKLVSREVVIHSGGVGVVALTEDNKVLMVRQYRYPIGEETLEIPAGKLSVGENPLECAKRELSEETGAAASRYTSLGYVYPSPGYSTEVLHLYLAQDLFFGDMHLDEDELLSVESVDIDELLNHVMSGKIKDAKTVIGVLKTKELLVQIKV